MSFEYDELSFGNYLKTKRLEKAICLEAISRKTHITVDMLLLLEKEAYSRLPAQVYVHGFIREYTRFVGIDTEAALKRYLIDYQAYQRAQKEKKRRFYLNPGSLWRVMALVVLAVVITGFVGSVIFLPDKSLSRQDRSIAASPEQNVENITTSAGAGKIATPLTLDVTVAEKTWLKVIADGKPPDVYHLLPQDRLVLQAVSGFNLLIGSAAGVKLVLDGKPVTVSGKSGQMATVQLP